MILRIFLCALWFIIELQLYGQQDLIQNGSFESFKLCPNRFTANDGIYLCDHWFLPAGSADLFSECAPRMVHVPKNFAGREDAFEGSSYAGAFLSKKNTGELLLNELSMPLEAGRYYKLTFYVSLSESSKYAAKGFDVGLSERMIRQSRDLRYIDTRLRIHDSISLEVFDGWAELCVVFQARGREQYLILGGMSTNQSFQSELSKGYRISYDTYGGGTYYYIDQVSLIPVEDGDACPNAAVAEPEVVMEEEVRIDSVFVFQSLQFDHASSVLRSDGVAELNRLGGYLLSNPEYKVHVIGHTDDQGDDAFNLDLSKRRSEAVCEYLQRMGVARERLSSEGRGENEPLRESSSPAARAVNRRVEVQLLK